MKRNVRALVLECLEKVLISSEFSDQVLNHVFKTEKDLDVKDRHFLEFLFYGVIERKETLSGFLRILSKVPEKKMKPKIRLILYMGLFQIFFSDVEPYALVNESVKLTVKSGFSGLKGFVNGVLRTAIREKDSLMEKLEPNEKYAVSKFLYDTVTKWYGKERANLFFLSLLSKDKSETCIRVSTSKVSVEEFKKILEEEKISFRPSEYTEDVLFLKLNTDIRKLKSFQEGFFYVQDLSSSLSGNAVKDLFSDPLSNEHMKVLDTCASPGGKSMHIAEFLNGKGKITSCDISEKKVQSICENIERMKYENIETKVVDASVFHEEFSGCFDLVICDAPCSGIGIIGNKPDIRMHVTEESLTSIENVQKNILDNVSKYVKPGGRLLYSTCTINPYENEKQVDTFLKNHPDFSYECFPKSFIKIEKLNVKENDSFITLLPDGIYPGTGFFFARLKRT